MADLDDIVEAVVDIEDVVEEVAEPDELVEDLIDNPFVIIFGLVAGFAGLLTLLLVAVTITAFVLSIGPVAILVGLTVFMTLVLLLGIGAFLYVQTDIPSNVQAKIDNALAQADDTPREDEEMTEQDAIDELKALYAEGELRDHELEQALDDVLTSDDPGEVVERYERS